MPLVQPFSFLGSAELAWAIPRDTGETDDYWGTRVEKARDASYYAVAYSGLEENPFGNKFDAWVVWTGAGGLSNDWFQLPGIDIAATPSVFDVSISDDGLWCLVYWRTTGWGEVRLFKRSGDNTWALHRDMRGDFTPGSTGLLWHCVLRDRYILGTAGDDGDEDSERRVFRIEPDETTVTNTYTLYNTAGIGYNWRYWMGDITPDGEWLCSGRTEFWGALGGVEQTSWNEVWKADNPGRTAYTKVWNLSLGYQQKAQVMNHARFSRDKYHVLFGTYTSGRMRVYQRQNVGGTNWSQVLNESVNTTYYRACDVGPGRDALGAVQESGPPYAGAQPSILYVERNTPGFVVGVWDGAQYVLQAIAPPAIFTDTRLYDGSLELVPGGTAYQWSTLGGPFDNLVAARVTY